MSGADVRVAVIGAGYLGAFHAEKYAAMPGVRLVGLADVDRERAARVADRIAAAAGRPVRAVADFRELLGEVDAVSIAVPTQAHYAVAAACLDAGVDVLVEKPMAATVAEAEDLIARASRGGRILAVGHLERFNPAVTALAGLVEDPMFIEVHRLGVFSERGTDVDVVRDLMIHDLDVVLTFVRAPLADVRAVGVPVIAATLDIANARLEFANGCVANVTASRVSRERMRKIRFFQRDVYVSVDYLAQELTVVRRLPPAAPGGRPEIVGEQRSLPKRDALADELAAFVAAVRTRRPAPVSGEDGLRALAVAERIVEVMRRYA
ncbi:MAG TPA: Gfo/Idh/MocA family oxidoreductase [Thermodesulfobacteriota bacterium]|nr:Gfo/Idh/MocA family oxidoreductase [Thermodesulfobacteriota bacterium]